MVKQGLRENWKQFSLLVLVNGFVGGILGLERSILPELLVDYVHASTISILFSFILVFGIFKAFSNYFTGRLSERIGRKKLLVLGWMVALPIPLLLMYGDSLIYFILANALLGISQGVTWSSTVIMKIDLVGEKQRGLAMGINESAGYVALGVSALLTAWITDKYGVQPYPFLLGLFYALLGLSLSALFVRDTKSHVQIELRNNESKKLNKLFAETTYKDKNLSSITQGGLINNLNDGMLWGLLPILLSSLNFGLHEIGVIVAIYPAVWGLGQLFTGVLADRLNIKGILVSGMTIQAIALLYLAIASSMFDFILTSVALGLGTALVYPAFLVGIAKYCPPNQRAECIGIYRLWRDLGYVFGAIFSVVLVAYGGINSTILLVACLTLGSALIMQWRIT